MSHSLWLLRFEIRASPSDSITGRGKKEKDCPPKKSVRGKLVIFARIFRLWQEAIYSGQRVAATSFECRDRSLRNGNRAREMRVFSSSKQEKPRRGEVLRGK